MPSNKKPHKRHPKDAGRESISRSGRSPSTPKWDVEHGRGITAREVGSGITKRKIRIFSGPFNSEEVERLKDLFARLSSAPSDPFVEMEAELRAFLGAAGFPIDPTEGDKFPFRSHITEELSKAERISGPWYAAAILDELGYRRWALSVGDVKGAELAACESVNLYREFEGKILYEDDILRGKAVREGSRQKKPERRIVELEKYIHFRRKDEELTYKKFKEELENTEDGDHLEWRNFQFWLDQGRVYVQEMTAGEEKKARSISL